MTWFDYNESQDAAPGHLLKGGEHFDDIQNGRVGAKVYVWGNKARNGDKSAPRDRLLTKLENLDGSTRSAIPVLVRKDLTMLVTDKYLVC